MHYTAKGLAALGRNGDDTLVHVNKDEIAGLQALLGHQLTTNPHTGLPEAFTLANILVPFGLGVATALTGGLLAPEIGAAGATAVSGLMGGTAGGLINKAQGKGFMPGFAGGLVSGLAGGYGGAGLAGGPTEAAMTSDVGSLATPGAQKTMEDQLTKNVFSNSAVAPTAPPSGAMGFEKQFPGLASEGSPNLSMPISEQLKSTVQTNGNPIATALQQPAGSPGMSPPSIMDNMGKQWSAMTTKEGMKNLIEPIGYGTLIGGGVTAALDQSSLAAKKLKEQQQLDALNQQNQTDYFGSLGFPLQTQASLNSPFWGTQRQNVSNLLQPTFAEGGDVQMRRDFGGTPVTTDIPAKYVDAFQNADLNHDLTQAMTQTFATGGYANTQPFNPQEFYPQSRIGSAQPYAAAGNTGVVNTLAHGASFAEGGSVYEKGGFLDGPGDGMSDDIPANIDGAEDVRLADGEFVIPPEIVRMIGDGDPERGSKLLDQLLPMVRQAAHGKKEQVKQDAGKLAAEKMLLRAKKKTHAQSHRA